MCKGGRRDALAINPQTAARLHAYLEKAGHPTDSDGPMFRPLRHNGKPRRNAGAWIPTQSTVSTANMPAFSGSIAATLRINARHVHHHGARKRRAVRKYA